MPSAADHRDQAERLLAAVAKVAAHGGATHGDVTSAAAIAQAHVLLSLDGMLRIIAADLKVLNRHLRGAKEGQP